MQEYHLWRKWKWNLFLFFFTLLIIYDIMRYFMKHIVIACIFFFCSCLENEFWIITLEIYLLLSINHYSITSTTHEKSILFALFNIIRYNHWEKETFHTIMRIDVLLNKDFSRRPRRKSIDIFLFSTQSRRWSFK